jgi:NHLM bacteriocin system ABC transporter ATP-binding protein
MISLAAARPLDLADLAAPLLVRTGAVNVFAAPAGGRRHFLFAVPAGAMLCGLPGTLRCIAVGTLGTTAAPLDPRDVTPALLAGWCAALGEQAVPAAALPALHARAVQRFTERVGDDAAARARNLRQGWERARDGYHAALAAFARLVMRPGAAPAVQEPPAAPPPAPMEVPRGVVIAGDSAAARAVRRIAAALGVAAVAAAETDKAEKVDKADDGAAAAALLARAGIRHRTVLLRGRWWRRDNGPLLGFDGQRRPCVLLPRKSLFRRRGYRLLDADGNDYAVDGATPLAAEALMPYRPLPPGTTGWRGLLRFAGRGTGPDIARLAALGAGAAMLALLVPAATALLVESVLPLGDRAAHGQLAGLLLAGAFGAAGFELCKALLVLRCEARVDLALQAAVFDRLLRLPVAFFRRHTVGDLADRALGVQEMRATLSVTAGGALLGAVFSLASLGAMLYYSVPLALAGMALAAGVLALTMACARRQLRQQGEQVRQRGIVEALVLQFVGGIGKLRAAAAEPRALAAWARHYEAQTRRFAAARAAALVQELVQACVPALAGLAIFAAIAYWPAAGGAAQLLAFNAAFGQFLGAMTGMTLAAAGALGVVPLYRRLRPLLEAQPEAGGRAPAALRGAIEFTGVSFGYDRQGPAILDDVSLAVAPGQFVAIVGPSGGGKSTLLRLMMGFEAPTAGTIAFDGQPLAELDAAALRRGIGVVLQHGRVAAGSVFDNIAGDCRITHDEAMAAARQVGLAADIDAMPMGLHTVLHDGGGTLSGGQRQRLLLARALVRRPALLLLDEATSALDNGAQAVLMDSLARLTPAITRVVVAHRLSTVIGADQILVVDRGRIVQRGRYAELIGRPGPFAELARRQLL